MEIKQQAVSKLANSMRLYGEAHMRFNQLKLVDNEEAIDNLDRAFEAKLEAFHSLYDVTKDDFDYFSHGDTALLILLRNAVHHRNHLLFKSWNQDIGLNDGHKKYLGAEFILASHEVVDASHVMRHFYKLEDFYLRIDPELESQYIENKMGSKNRLKLLQQIKSELNFDLITAYAKDGRYPTKQIYVNLIPIFISAVCKVFKKLNERGAEFIGFDANTYKEPFTNELKVDFSSINYTPIRIL
ncbi:hypothetical protein [Vibrio crassostreae]|uniref:hypothetical protein n=1 Tax=Vibrio crassostreae TaxID=246167 RepID=UPI00104D06F7|nr:hypothetical protein [Vibrio crassostreae]TCV24479.1 hypothetical protein EDB71_111183 [Vibrio crassostreae]